MAKRKKSVRTGKNPYLKCMSGPNGQIHKERVKLKQKLHTTKLTPKQAGLAMKNAAKVCKR